jgi:hypothetical protein
MLTNSWLRTGQLYLTDYNIFSLRSTYFVRSTFFFTCFGLFRPSFLLPVLLAYPDFYCIFYCFCQPHPPGLRSFWHTALLEALAKKQVFCRCFRSHCSFDKDFRLLSVLSFWSVCLTVITSCRFYNFNSTIASSQLGNKLSKVAKSSAK